MPAESGVIGAACEVPETAATIKVAAAIAKISAGANPEHKTIEKRSRFRAVPSRFKYRPSKFSDFNFAPLPEVDGTFRRRLWSSIDVTTAALGHAPQ
jgi:hypothetical protein